jgi:hypothetical protein
MLGRNHSKNFLHRALLKRLDSIENIVKFPIWRWPPLPCQRVLDSKIKVLGPFFQDLFPCSARERDEVAIVFLDGTHRYDGFCPSRNDFMLARLADDAFDLRIGQILAPANSTLSRAWRKTGRSSTAQPVGRPGPRGRATATQSFVIPGRIPAEQAASSAPQIPRRSTMIDREVLELVGGFAAITLFALVLLLLQQ